MPADEFSPGAGELEAPQRIADKAVKNGDDMKLIKAGCRWLDAKARERGEQNFVGLNEAGREAVTRLG